VRRVLEYIQTDIRIAMLMTSCNTLKDIKKTILIQRYLADHTSSTFLNKSPYMTFYLSHLLRLSLRLYPPAVISSFGARSIVICYFITSRLCSITYNGISESHKQWKHIYELLDICPKCRPCWLINDIQGLPCFFCWSSLTA